MFNHMPRSKTGISPIVGAREAMKILDCDRATVHRWGREGRITIIGQLGGGNSAVVFDRRSVERLATKLRAEAEPDADAS
jgi:predicted site-specific integrase-resolvase